MDRLIHLIYKVWPFAKNGSITKDSRGNYVLTMLGPTCKFVFSVDDIWYEMTQYYNHDSKYHDILVQSHIITRVKPCVYTMASYNIDHCIATMFVILHRLSLFKMHNHILYLQYMATNRRLINLI